MIAEGASRRARVPEFITRILLTALTLGFQVGATLAAPIPVNNPSFEDIPAAGLTETCGGGCSYSIDFIPGWLNTPFLGLGLNSGQFRPGMDVGNTTYFDTMSDGPTSAYTTTGCISQTVGATVQAGMIYTLQADVGWRKDAGPTGVPRILVNDIYHDGTGTAVFGGWTTFTAVYMARAEDVGMPITICLNSVTFQGNFDNVRFSDSIASSAVELSPPPGLGLEAKPNPFDAAARVIYSLPRTTTVTLRVFDVSGRVVRTLVPESIASAGSHGAAWDGADDRGARVASGLYFLRLDTAEGSRVARVFRTR